MRSVLVALPLAALAAGAMAADLPRSAPMVVAAPLFSWTGAYSGIFAGYGKIDNKTTPVCTGIDGVSNGLFCPIRSPSSPRADDFIAGSELGYNYQFTPGSGIVLGAAVDYQITPIRSHGTETADFPVGGLPGSTYPGSIYHIGQRLDWLATARAKVGYAFDRVLVYGTAGLAVGDVRIDTNTNLAGAFVFDSRSGDRRFGYVAGGGVEYAISPHLSVKSEVLYYDLGAQTVAGPEVFGAFPGLTVGGRVETSGVLGRAGLNYRFDDGGLPVIGPLTDVVSALVDPQPYVPLVAQVWDFEVGARYLYSSGTSRKTLGDPFDPIQANSRLTYRDFPAQGGETFARLDHVPSGLFLKGFFGSGSVTSGGKLNDEDFPPLTVPYSNTLSKIRTGDVAMAVADVGYTLLRTDDYKLGAFVGYQYLAERANGFGCVQVAGNPDICSGAGAVPNSVSLLTQDNHWTAFRVGLAGEVRYERFKLNLEGAYLPVANVSGYDRHWLRPDINPLLETGSGDGYFLQGIVSYALTQSISIGIGGRYTRMTTDRNSGSTQFPFAGLPASPQKYATDRYGVFAQMSYSFTDPDFGLGSLVRK